MPRNARPLGGELAVNSRIALQGRKLYFRLPRLGNTEQACKYLLGTEITSCFVHLLGPT